MKQKNSIWNFFASVKLAIFTLSFIALTSIIGTVVQQGKSHSFYVETYGPRMAQFFKVLDISDMYYSWWFVGFLGLLCANLIICSFDRFPAVLKIIRADNLSIKPGRLEKMAEKKSWKVTESALKKINFANIIQESRWEPQVKKIGNNELFFSQKGAWSRTGVYIVHTSIIIIFIGAIIGHFLGFKGSIMIPETKSSTKIFSFDDSEPIELGFEIRCDFFAIEYYDNGMPKEYESGLTVLENGQEILRKKIEVNNPLTYKGITFYQSSYEGYQDFIISIRDDTDIKESKSFIVPFQKQKSWAEKELRFGIINAEAKGQKVVRSKLWLKAGDGPAAIEWLEDGKELTITSDDNSYTVTAKQMYATGLQVAKDPGVWFVYVGCGLMLIGLYMAFFMSHKRIWLYKRTDESGTELLLAGSVNKNKAEFSKQFSKLANRISKNIDSHGA